MKTNKQHQVIMLPTSNESNFYTLLGNQNQQLYLSKGNIVRDTLQQNQHLYIVSNEEIKEGDWCYHIASKEIVKYPKGGFPKNHSKKIIATTDTSLLIKNVITDLIQGTKCLPQPTQEWVEHYTKEYNKGNIITEILVEYEDNRLRDGYSAPYKDYKKLKTSKDNTITIFKSMKMLLVIHEKDLDDKEQIVVGVADSVENAEKIINEYYGEYKEISYNDIRDSNLEYSKVLELKGFLKEPYRVEIWLEWFQLNCI